MSLSEFSINEENIYVKPIYRLKTNTKINYKMKNFLQKEYKKEKNYINLSNFSTNKDSINKNLTKNKIKNYIIKDNNYKKHIKTESSFLNYDLGTLNLSSYDNISSNSINLSFENESFVNKDENLIIKEDSVELIDFMQQNINDISKQLNSFYNNKNICDIENIEEFDSFYKINLIKKFRKKRSKLIDNPSLLKSIIKILFNSTFINEKEKNQETNKIKKTLKKINSSCNIMNNKIHIDKNLYKFKHFKMPTLYKDLTKKIKK